MLENKEEIVSIIIIARNAADTIGICIESLLQNDYPRNKFEIIVIDNGSTDQTKLIVSRYPVKYVFEKKIGRAPARNAGIRSSQGQIIVFIDSDCTAEKNWLRSHVKLLSESDSAAAVGSVIPVMPKSLKLDASHYSYFGEFYPLRVKSKLTWNLITCNASFKRDVFNQVGGFNEKLKHCEDTEFSNRILKKGFKITFDPTPIVYHHYTSCEFKPTLKKKAHDGYWYYFVQIPQRLPMGRNRVPFMSPIIIASRLVKYVINSIRFNPNKINAVLVFPYLCMYSFYWTAGYLNASKSTKTN